MLMVAATPFAGLLELFVAVPLGIVCSIYGVECAFTLRQRHRHAKETAQVDGARSPWAGPHP